MANPNLKVKIGGDIAEIKSALAALRGDLSKTQKAAASTNVNRLTSSLKGLVGAVAGIGAVGLAIRGIFNATVAAEKAQAQLNAVLKSTGGAAGLSATELNKMAEGLQAITTFDDEAITGAQSLLLTFTKIGRDVFPEATKAALNMSVALGQELNSSALQIGKALNDPIKGITALTRAGVQFTDKQKDVITQLVETGRVAEAQKIILKELEVQMGGSAEAARNTLGGALQGLKNDFDNLLEGDSGGDGIRGATDAVNELGKTLQSAEVKAGFAYIISALAGLVEFVAKGVAALGGLGQAVVDAVSSDNEKTYTGLLAKRIRLEERLAANQDLKGLGGIQLNKETQAEIDALDLLINKRREAAGIGGGQKKGPVIDFSNFNPPPPPEETTAAARAREAAAKAAKDAAEKAAREAKTARDKRAADEKEAADKAAALIEDRNKRIAAGMFDVNNQLLINTGNAAQAAFNEIDAKYAELLKDLRDAGGKEGEILEVDKLINLEKAKVTLDDLRNQTRAVLDDLRSETAFINDQVGIPGGITATDAEQQLQALRQKTLDQLIKLRDAAKAAYDQKPSPETLAALRDLNVAIGQVQQTQNEFANQVKDGARNALSTFFTDLATGAKTFKEAFKDMVRSFLQGIAQMIAQKLALKAVDAIAGVFGFHGGGMAGAGGSFRREVNPMIFTGAPRYHDGGIAGLKPGEVPAILQTGERVLSRRETARYNAGDRPSPGTRVVNVFEPSFVPDQMDSAAGEKVILNIIGRNPSRIQQMLR